ncbi:hypothetical protein KGM_204220 [Danaus plexippus plexippus]|uniref:Uncharacterized protein n=1 Tax=Danaus plexippus plexippus TaxID=278856 RepID=A0A212EP44_DANPL|nr:hypothetical protein KGM_204220 [Danaus plexippus plexippus]
MQSLLWSSRLTFTASLGPDRPPNTSIVPIELRKRLEEIRLLESRKSARLADVDTDFARLADMAGDRRRASATIEVPAHHMQGSRKRGPSSSCELGYGERDDQMNECNAALVLMSLSCSPNSPRPSAWGGRSSVSPGASSSSGSSWRSGTPSPPPVSSSFSDEGIAMDYEDLHPRKKRPPYQRLQLDRDTDHARFHIATT